MFQASHVQKSSGKYLHLEFYIYFDFEQVYRFSLVCKDVRRRINVQEVAGNKKKRITTR